MSTRLPKIESKKSILTGKKKYYVNGRKVKVTDTGDCRRKIVLKEMGIIIKLENAVYKHDDLAAFARISKKDLKYFPSLYKQTKTYSIHQYVPHKPLRLPYDTELYEKGLSLAEKYKFKDISIKQMGKRISDGELVIFDYGYVGRRHKS